MSDHEKQEPTDDNTAGSDAAADGTVESSGAQTTTHPPVRKRSRLRWLLPAAALAAVVALGFVLRSKLHDDIWAYYTDDEGLRVSVEENKERMVLWEDPQQHLFQEHQPDPDNPGGIDRVNQASQRVEAAFSADGTVMVLTRWSKKTAEAAGQKADEEAVSEGDNEINSEADAGESNTGPADADLYVSRWNGRTWSRPEPMVDLNTTSNERGAAFSARWKLSVL